MQHRGVTYQKAFRRRSGSQSVAKCPDCGETAERIADFPRRITLRVAMDLELIRNCLDSERRTLVRNGEAIEVLPQVTRIQSADGLRHTVCSRR